MRCIVLAGGIAALLFSIAPFAHAQGTDPTHVRTQSGEDLGILSLQDISEGESSVHFIQPGDVKRRQAQVLKDRRIEALILRNNASLTYTKIIIRRNTFGPASYDLAPTRLAYRAGTNYLTDHGFAFKENEIKRAGTVAYEVQASAKGTCFLYDAFLSDGIDLTQEVNGSICYRSGVRSAAQLEQEMLSLLSRARFARGSSSSDFSATLEIPATQQ